jgi:ribosomal protein S12 methylthiotransferase
MRVQLLTLGCSKNRVDSEHLLKQLEAFGIEISPEGESLVDANVDLFIINTCGFINDAKEESIEAILDAVEAKKRGYISKLFVFGCLSQRYKKDLITEIPEVDAFFGAYDIDNILAALSIPFKKDLLTQRFLTTPSHYAYLKIAEGCDRRCSYCAIPNIRGNNVSIPIETLVKEANSLVAKGVKELIVIAQDTTYYGIDIYKKRSLGNLLKELEKIEGLEWIRIHYSYPDSFPEDVLDIMATSDKVCKYIDIPLQHSSSKVLDLMHRSIDGVQTRSLVKRMREKVPGIVIRTTMMVGHPGEGRGEFNDLIKFVKEYPFERLGAFTYSQEEGTWGAANLEDKISQKVKNSRYEQLMEIQSEISLRFNLSRIGTVEKVIVDSFSDGIFYARSSKESPEVDGDILIYGDFDSTIIGTFVNVKIISANEYDLVGEIIDRYETS